MSDALSPLRRDRAPVLFCTDSVAARRGAEFRAVMPDLDIVILDGDQRVPEEQLARVTYAFFSADAYPDRSRAFMGSCVRIPDLVWLHTFSAGVDHPVFGSLFDAGTVITTSSGSTAAPIAQTVMMYLLALSRDLPAWHRAQAAHRWEPRTIRELDGAMIGVVGTGPIGLEVIRLATTFGMHPIAMRRRVRCDEPFETWTLDRLGELAARVDALVLALPLTPETRGLVDASILDAMRPGSWFVNIGRGELVDEDALVHALATGHLGGAGLDVFATEPLPEDHPLWDLPNVIITPHSSGSSPRSAQRAEEIFVDNLRRVAEGRPLRNRV